MPEIDDRLIIAIDTPSISRAQLIIETTRDVCQNYKFGMTFFARNSMSDVSTLYDHFVFKAMIDKKYHDVPSQVADAVEELASYQFVRYATIHISGGREMLTQAIAASNVGVIGRVGSLKLLGITVLTSLDDNDLADIIPQSPMFGTDEWVAHLDKLATAVQLPGRVCAAREVSDILLLEEAAGTEKILVVPGISIGASANPGQKRIGSPGQAIKDGASHIVVGRYITQKGVLDMLDATNTILTDMAKAADHE